jgi:DNA repair exonuclease SbcCD ATPase subunit
MGWPSYLEDLIEKFNVEMKSCLARPDWRARDYEQPREILERWTLKFRGVLGEVKDYVSLATDPEVNLAMRVRGLERENAELRVEREKYRQLSKEASEIAEASRRDESTAKKQAADAISEAQRLQTILNRIHERHPELLYDLYTPDDPRPRGTGR